MDLVFFFVGILFGLAIVLISAYVVTSGFGHDFEPNAARSLLGRPRKKSEEEDDFLRNFVPPKTRALSAPSGNPVTPGLTFNEPCVVIVID